MFCQNCGFEFDGKFCPNCETESFEVNGQFFRDEVTYADIARYHVFPRAMYMQF